MGEDSVKCDIFISYRRDGGQDKARNLQLALSAMGYSDIFFDFNSLRDGKFNEKILDAISVCKDFILILSPGSMDRCVNEEDWVRIEVLAAIDAGCNIIPVTIDDHGIVFPEELPKKFDSIKQIQQSKLRTDEFFDDSVRRISERLKSVKKAKGANGDGFILIARTDETCELLIEGERYSKIKAGKFTRVTVLKPGEEYRLTFRSLATQKDTIERTYRCPKISKTDEISVSFIEYRASLREAREHEERRNRQREAKRTEKENLRSALMHYDDRDVSAYGGMTLVREKDLFGYVDEKGLETVPCQYEGALHFSDGYACVKKGGKWGLIDTDDRTVLPFESQVPSYCSKGIVVSCKGGKYGAISIEGKVTVPYEYDHISQPRGSVVLARKGKNLFLLTLDGENPSGTTYDDVETSYIPFGIEASRWMVTAGGDKGFLDSVTKGRSDMFGIVPVVPGIVQSRGRMGYVGTDGKLTVPCIAEQITPTYYESGDIVKMTFPNFLLAKCHGKWGVFDPESGAIVIPLKYDTIDFQGDCFLVGEGILGKDDFDFQEHDIPEMMGAVDTNGIFFIPLEYNMIFHRSFHSRDEDGYMAIKVEGKPTIDDLRYISRLIAPFVYYVYYTDPYLDPYRKKANQDLRFYVDDYFYYEFMGKATLISRREYYQGKEVSYKSFLKKLDIRPESLSDESDDGERQ